MEQRKKIERKGANAKGTVEEYEAIRVVREAEKELIVLLSKIREHRRKNRFNMM